MSTPVGDSSDLSDARNQASSTAQTSSCGTLPLRRLGVKNPSAPAADAMTGRRIPIIVRTIDETLMLVLPCVRKYQSRLPLRVWLYPAKAARPAALTLTTSGFFTFAAASSFERIEAYAS